MRRIFFSLLLFLGISIGAQFKIEVVSDRNLEGSEAFFYTLNGSKDVLVGKVLQKKGQWKLVYPKSYTGMMKIYFPEFNYNVNLVSENKDVAIRLTTEGDKITEVIFSDEVNALMDEVQGLQMRKKNILPVLSQIKGYYKPSAPFYKNLNEEITRLSSTMPDVSVHPFIGYYTATYGRFLLQASEAGESNEEVLRFISNSGDYLETSGLMKPLLLTYLKNAGGVSPETAVQNLLDEVNVETPRGQTVLSELIDIFDAYGMTALKEKYLTEAKNLKCTINERLASTLETNKRTEIGAKLPDYVFRSATNTKAKSIAAVKAKKKVLVFWSSTCSHCETELPKFIPYYEQMKRNGVEIIGLSFDSDKASYLAKAESYPWINDSELKGWYSSYGELYNIHATPSYIILNENNVILDKPEHFGEVISSLDLK
ncbi:TlpA family protein disulfide reductase [Bergeyella sp. RCAD1439]|uniref:TlpA family protein disulfide reductase n=1 Tax=Bergeyella anatis TaxID=3113737 RepID=UPI002E170FD6|nr:TlpA disulfide reductase family protein [Bergeyella sp. RCAD1439]